MAGAGSSSGKRKRRRKKAAAAAALSQSLTNNNESQVAVTGLDQHVRAAGSSRMSKSSKEGEWEDEEEQELLRTPKALPRFKSLSKPSVKELPKVTKDKSSKEKEKIKPGGITILARPKAAPTSSISDVSADGEDDEWEGVDSGSSKERQGNAGGQPKAGNKDGVSGAASERRRNADWTPCLGYQALPTKALSLRPDNDDSAADVYDDDPEDEISPNLARKWKQAADTEPAQVPYPRTSSLGSELGFEAPGVGTGSGSRTPRPADNARIDELEAEESLVLDDAPLPPAMNGTGTSVTGHKKKKRSRRARTLLARSKSYPNLRAAAELGTESLKRRLGFLGSGGSAGSGAGPNGLDLEADLYLDQNKRNRLYILAHKLLTAFPEQKRDLKRIILKLEQSTLNGATSSSSSTKKKGHKRSTSSGGYTSGGYGSGAGIGIGTIPSMASFSNPDYIDYDEPQDPAEFDVQGPAHTPGASIVHVFIDQYLEYPHRPSQLSQTAPAPQSTVDEYITSRTRLTSHSTPALIDVEVDGEISIPSHNADNPRTRNGSKPIPIPGKGKGKMPVVETPTPSAEEYPIPLPSFATAKSKGTPKRHSNPQASLVALSKSLPSESFLRRVRPVLAMKESWTPMKKGAAQMGG
ncbi:hypothetical protein BKA70DRAFT_1433203 [Coprinopsis sp. MPI-PUGE-AT-0042]|nr:hypothetical protein BKA70DRAFT_1433203 [Coprinopsis sp. MPI-PUGE-AT-0042]